MKQIVQSLEIWQRCCCRSTCPRTWRSFAG